MTYNEELIEIKKTLADVVYYAPVHYSYCGCGGKNVSRSALTKALDKMGYTLDATVHAYGIGNNNENKVIKRIDMGNGYESEVVMGFFHYTYSMYARACSFWFEDKDHKTIFKSGDLGLKIYSENEY